MFQSYCRKKSCGTIVKGDETKCPNCGGTMASASWIKITGWLMTVVGALIAFPMVFVVMKFLPTVANPATAAAEGRFGATADMVIPSFFLLLLVLVFGSMLLLFGAQRAIKGTRHPLATPLVLLTGFAFLALFFYAGSSLPNNQTVHGIPVEDIR